MHACPFRRSRPGSDRSIGVFSAARAVCSSPSGTPATFGEYLGIGRADGERILGLGDLKSSDVLTVVQEVRTSAKRGSIFRDSVSTVLKISFASSVESGLRRPSP